MNALPDRIHALSDADARRVLATFASHQPGYQNSAVTPELEQALRNDPTLTAEAASEGDLARAALLLLADDPQHQPILTAMIDGPAPAKFGLLETAAIISAVLFALQTHVKFERDKDGRWTFKIEKKPTDTALLKSLMQKLLAIAGNES